MIHRACPSACPHLPLARWPTPNGLRRSTPTKIIEIENTLISFRLIDLEPYLGYRSTSGIIQSPSKRLSHTGQEHKGVTITSFKEVVRTVNTYVRPTLDETHVRFIRVNAALHGLAGI
jgi:hypothetical protein